MRRGANKVKHILSIEKVKRSRCMAVCLIKVEGVFYCVIALKNHLIAVKQIPYQNEPMAFEIKEEEKDMIMTDGACSEIAAD